MTDYQIKYTDNRKTPITVVETSIDNASVDISLFGRKKLEYGRDMNANFLHILENFACHESPLSPGNPDTSKTSFIGETTRRLLDDPTEGQLWFNETQETLFVYDGAIWLALGMLGDIAANWGVIAHGEFIPRPVNQNGYQFRYDECSWIVSPFAILSSFTYMQCLTDSDAQVTMTYTPEGGTSVTGCANYLIVGIKDNVNLGQLVPVPSATPAPTPTTTPTTTPAASSAGVTPTPTLTKTPPVTPTISITPTPGVTATGTPGPTPTPTATRTKTPAATPPVSPPSYFTTITSALTGTVLPGTLICYNISLNLPAPAGGYSFTMRRSGDYNSICASTDGELGGPLIETIPLTIAAGQTTIQICRTAPLAPPPPPTPTPTPRIACKTMPGNNPLDNGSTAGYKHGFMCANTSGGALVYFTNASSNFDPCTAWSACNTAESFISTQTIANNPYRAGATRYNATPAMQIALTITIPGVGSANFNQYIYGTSNITQTFPVNIGGRSYTVTLNMYPTLVSTSGSNKTWQVSSNYTVTDNALGTTVNFC